MDLLVVASVVPADEFKQRLFNTLDMFMNILDVVDQFNLSVLVFGTVKLSRILIELINQITDRLIKLYRLERLDWFFNTIFNHNSYK